MLGVAMASATPDQRWPGPGEAISLAASGMKARCSGLLAAARGPAWRDAAAVVGLIGPILIAAIYAEALAGRLAWDSIGGLEFWNAGGAVLAPPGGQWQAPVIGLALAGGWALVAAAAILRWRRVAAAGASLGVAAEAVLLVARYPGDPSYLIASWWQVMLAVVTALAAVITAAGPGGRARPISLRAVTAVTAVAVALAGIPAAEAASTSIVTVTGQGVSTANPLSGIERLLAYGLFAGLAITVLVVITRLRPAARRRVLVLSVPVAAAAALSATGSRVFLTASQGFAYAVLPTAPQWAALWMAPVLAFAIGMAWLSRHERMLRLLADGQRDAL